MIVLQRLRIWINYLLKGKSRYLVHSPFVFSFINDILLDNRVFYPFEQIEALRSKLQKDNRTLTVVELGAGKGKGQRKMVRLTKLAARTAITPKYGQLLFRLVDHFQPKNILEIGTGLGLSAAYIASASGQSRVITLEGNDQTAAIAMENFSYLGLKNIVLLKGDFDDTLPAALKQAERLDMVFIDGNHEPSATLRYFRACLGFVHPGTIMIFDDINWSAGMQAAWQEMTMCNQVKLAIGLHRMGILFFNNDLKRHEYIQLYY